jgi:hypothetical protein
MKPTLKFAILIILILLGVIFLTRSLGQEAEDPEAQALLERLDNARYPDAYEMTISMLTTRPGRDDLSYEYDIIGVGTDKSLMTVTAPARERDQQILLNGDNLWLFVPDVSRPVKLTRKQSFMGSTFSNEDVMNSTLADDYTAKVLLREIRDGKPYYKVELNAKNRSVAYAKMTAGIDSITAIPDTIVYYGLSGKALKEMVSFENKMLAGRLRPSRMIMYDFLEEGAWTEVDIKTLSEKEDIPESVFNPTRMGK